MLFVFGIASCSAVDNRLISPGLIEPSVNDVDYGLVANKPVKLGGFMRGTKHAGYHIEYFSSLVGPQGQSVSYRRLGRCCAFRDISLPFGAGFLDKYELTYKGINKPVVIYVNLYKYEQPKAPKGFRLNK